MIMSMPELEAVKGPGEHIIHGKSVDLTEPQAAEAVRQIEAHEGLAKALEKISHEPCLGYAGCDDTKCVCPRGMAKQALSKEPK